MANAELPLRTSRLVLRAWEDRDLLPFAALNADPRVMEHFPGLLSFDETREMVKRLRTHLEAHGFGLLAIEAPGVAPFVGFVGLSVPTFEATFMPCVEIAWRLSYDFWGRGYATEGARAILRFGFDRVGLEQIVSFTATTNRRSEHLMRSLGMRRDSVGDFEHPRLPEGHPLRRHVLYRLTREQWAAADGH